MNTLNTTKEEVSAEAIDKILLDITIDFQNEILKQCRKAELDDYQTDQVNNAISYVMDIKKGIYIKRVEEYANTVIALKKEGEALADKWIREDADNQKEREKKEESIAVLKFCLEKDYTLDLGMFWENTDEGNKYTPEQVYQLYKQQNNL
jgi:hypothetical protein